MNIYIPVTTIILHLNNLIVLCICWPFFGDNFASFLSIKETFTTNLLNSIQKGFWGREFVSLTIMGYSDARFPAFNVYLLSYFNPNRVIFN